MNGDEPPSTRGSPVSNESATLVLNGKVFLDDFAKAVQFLRQLMDGLSADLGTQRFEWLVDGLETGSAFITLEAPESAKVVKAYAKVGMLLQRNQPLPFSTKVKQAANGLRGLMNGRITSLRFETSESDSEVHSHPEERPDDSRLVHSYSAIQGRVQSISNRGRLRFTLYESQQDRAVSCYLSEGCEDVMRNAWGQLVVVEGVVSRDALNGAILSVREISPRGVRLVPSSKYTWRDAIGCCPAPENSIPTEDSVRQSRDRGVSSIPRVSRKRKAST